MNVSAYFSNLFSCFFRKENTKKSSTRTSEAGETSTFFQAKEIDPNAKMVTKSELEKILRGICYNITRIDNTPFTKDQKSRPYFVADANCKEGELPEQLEVKMSPEQSALWLEQPDLEDEKENSSSTKLKLLSCMYNELYKEYNRLNDTHKFNMTEFYEDFLSESDIKDLTIHRSYFSGKYSAYVPEPKIMQFLRSTGYQEQ